MELSRDNLEQYLDETKAYDEINMMLFNLRVDCVGKVERQEWREVLGRTEMCGSVVGLE